MTESNIARTSGIRLKDKIGYAFGDLASCLVFGLTQSVLNKYYTDVLEISVLHVMIMTIIARIWDAINDPIWGRIIDRAKVGKDGRYRRWIKVFSLPVALACFGRGTDVPGCQGNGSCRKTRVDIHHLYPVRNAVYLYQYPIRLTCSGNYVG